MVKLVFRRRSQKYSYELLKLDEVEKYVDEIAKSVKSPLLSNKVFLRNTLSNQESNITIVAKKKKELIGVVNGLSIKNQPINPQIAFVWTKHREASMEGVPQMLLQKFEEEAKKRNPRVSSISVNIQTSDLSSITLYCMSSFFIEGFIKGFSGEPDVVVMRRSLNKPSSTPIA
jgi:hypothetical protein